MRVRFSSKIPSTVLAFAICPSPFWAETFGGFSLSSTIWSSTLDRLFGNDLAEASSIDRLRQETGVNLFDSGGLLRILVDQFNVAQRSLGDPKVIPDLSEFNAVQSTYREMFSAVLDEHDLDALVFPQMLSRTPSLSGGNIVASSV